LFFPFCWLEEHALHREARQEVGGESFSSFSPLAFTFAPALFLFAFVACACPSIFYRPPMLLHELFSLELSAIRLTLTFILGTGK